MKPNLKAVPVDPAPEPVTIDNDYTPVPLRPRRNGWTAERQRTFLTVLAETGSISHACTEAGISPRSAYRLRARAEATAFADAWEQALKLAAIRLVTIAFERATRGTVKEFWKNGELVGETRSPSDKVLMFILRHLLPNGAPGSLAVLNGTMTDEARKAFPAARSAGRQRRAARTVRTARFLSRRARSCAGEARPPARRRRGLVTRAWLVRLL